MAEEGIDVVVGVTTWFPGAERAVYEVDNEPTIWPDQIEGDAAVRERVGEWRDEGHAAGDPP